MNLTNEGLKEFYEKYATADQKYFLDSVATVIYGVVRGLTLNGDVSGNAVDRVRGYFHKRFYKGRNHASN